MTAEPSDRAIAADPAEPAPAPPPGGRHGGDATAEERSASPAPVAGDVHDAEADADADLGVGAGTAVPAPAAGPPVQYDLRTPRRERSPADVLRLLLGLVLLALGLAAATLARNTVGGVEADIVELYDRIPDRVAEVLTAFAFLLAIAVPLLGLAVLVVRRRWRRVVALVVGANLASWVTSALVSLLADRGVIERVRQETSGEVDLTDPASPPPRSWRRRSPWW